MKPDYAFRATLVIELLGILGTVVLPEKCVMPLFGVVAGAVLAYLLTALKRIIAK